jgi:signal transduction histidine kinase
MYLCCYEIKYIIKYIKNKTLLNYFITRLLEIILNTLCINLLIALSLLFNLRKQRNKDTSSIKITFLSLKGVYPVV